MFLSGKALEVNLELVAEIAKLDSLQREDKLNDKFQYHEIFESCKRPSDINLHQLLIEFDQKCYKLKRHQAVITGKLLGYKLSTHLTFHQINNSSRP